MNELNELVNNLTQKDEAKALQAAKSIIDTRNLAAFEKLCEKSEFLFDFVKNNVRKRFKKAVNVSNYKNLTAFFSVYCEEYADTFLESMADYADESMSDEMFEMLENGSISHKKYAAKYFGFIPDTIALETLEKYAFGEDMQLALNCARALGKMNDCKAFENAILKLQSDDEFERIKAVRFLCAFGDKSALKELLKTLETSSAAENIAGELPYLLSFLEMLETEDKDGALNCFDLILSGLGEIHPLGDLFFFGVFEVLQYLIELQNDNATQSQSHVAAVLLRAYEKFLSLSDCDEYLFDEPKDVKEEINYICNLLKSQSEQFWDAQKELVVKELACGKFRALAALDVIRLFSINSAKSGVLEFINLTTDEQSLLAALSTAKAINILGELQQAKLAEKISNPTLKAVFESYFV